MPLFLKQYIYGKGWTDFRDIQKKAFDVLFDSDDHLLISAGTSSGKTEAALFPVITSLYDDEPDGIGAVYIGPLKALIDDQSNRLETILKDSGMNVTAWHGDINSNIKQKIIKNPRGILQITPESLQGLIKNRTRDVARMFSDLRFVIIDEVHAFMNSTRGLQLLCEFDSLRRIAGCNPRMIGLSATLSDMSVAERWLAAGTDRHVTTVTGTGNTDYSLALSFHFLPYNKELNRTHLLDFYRSLKEESDGYNCIIFVNSRVRAEKVSRSLDKMTTMCDVRVHHGSISKEGRKNAEAALKNTERKAITVATSTLELGIDVGDLDRVIQLDPPSTSSSFVQRMGRSGRRTGRPVMRVMCTGNEKNEAAFYNGIPMDFIRGIAICELFVKDRWVEEICHSRMPFGLLYQQTMIRIFSSNFEVTIDDLFRDVLSMYPFRSISTEDYVCLLKHMIKNGDLEYMDYDGRGVKTFGIGRKGEHLMSGPDILATFTDDNEYVVKFNNKDVGYVTYKPTLGSVILLAGSSWVVKSIRETTVHVEMTDNVGETLWSSGLPDVHTRIIRKMRDILSSDEDYPYLDDNARNELMGCRSNAHLYRILPTFVQYPGYIQINPWLGTVQFVTLVKLLEKMADLTIDRSHSVQPYTITVRTNLSISELKERIEQARKTTDPMDLVSKYDHGQRERFDMMIPVELRIKRNSVDRIDLDFDLI